MYSTVNLASGECSIYAISEKIKNMEWGLNVGKFDVVVSKY